VLSYRFNTSWFGLVAGLRRDSFGSPEFGRVPSPLEIIWISALFNLYCLTWSHLAGGQSPTMPRFSGYRLVVHFHFATILAWAGIGF
jgi:hypothetical protein